MGHAARHQMGHDCHRQMGHAACHQVGHAPCPQVGHAPCPQVVHAPCHHHLLILPVLPVECPFHLTQVLLVTGKENNVIFYIRYLEGAHHKVSGTL